MCDGLGQIEGKKNKINHLLVETIEATTLRKKLIDRHIENKCIVRARTVMKFMCVFGPHLSM